MHIEDIALLYDIEPLASTQGVNRRVVIEGYMTMYHIIYEAYGDCWEIMFNNGHYKIERLGPYFREVDWDAPQTTIYGPSSNS
jgi:hypothetical protein